MVGTECCSCCRQVSRVEPHETREETIESNDDACVSSEETIESNGEACVSSRAARLSRLSMSRTPEPLEREPHA